MKEQATSNGKRGKSGLLITAVAGLVTGGPIGLVASPTVFHLLGKRGLLRWQRWLAWGLCGVVAAPLSLLPFSLTAGEDVNTTLRSTAISESPTAEERQTAEAAAKEEEDRKAAAAEAEAKAQFKAVFGFESETEFLQKCQSLIASESGSTDFGVLNTETFQHPEIGSLVANQSVYGKNAFGAKVEQRYKCWNSNAEQDVQIELIGTQFH